MNELALITPPAASGWALEAAAADDRFIRGTLLRFGNDGLWRAGKETTPIPDTWEFAAVDTRTAWLKWEDGVPNYVIPDSSGRLVSREALGDHDEAEWPVNELSGKREDPWKVVKAIYLVDVRTAGTFTHTNHTVGTKIAISELAAKITMMWSARPGAVPVVKLSSVPMKTKFGTRPRPHFEVTDWRGGTTPDAPQISPPTLREELNDEIGF